MNPYTIDLKRGGRLLVSQLRTGEVSVMIDNGKGLTGSLLSGVEICELAAVLTSCARKRD